MLASYMSIEKEHIMHTSELHVYFCNDFTSRAAKCMISYISIKIVALKKYCKQCMEGLFVKKGEVWFDSTH